MQGTHTFESVRTNSPEEKKAGVWNLALLAVKAGSVPLRNGLWSAFTKPGDFRRPAKVVDDFFMIHTGLKHTFKSLQGTLSALDGRILT